MAQTRVRLVHLENIDSVRFMSERGAHPKPAVLGLLDTETRRERLARRHIDDPVPIIGFEHDVETQRQPQLRDDIDHRAVVHASVARIGDRLAGVEQQLGGMNLEHGSRRGSVAAAERHAPSRGRGSLARVLEHLRMKLLSYPTSPFARKVRIAAIEVGVIHAIDIVEANPLADDGLVSAHNPLGKIPALVLDHGTLVDSPVICAYLDTLHDGPKLHPQGDATRRAARGDAARLAPGRAHAHDGGAPWAAHPGHRGAAAVWAGPPALRDDDIAARRGGGDPHGRRDGVLAAGRLRRAPLPLHGGAPPRDPPPRLAPRRRHLPRRDRPRRQRLPGLDLLHDPDRRRGPPRTHIPPTVRMERMGPAPQVGDTVFLVSRPEQPWDRVVWGWSSPSSR